MDQNAEPSSQGALLLCKIEQQAILQYLIERVAVSLNSQEKDFEEVSDHIYRTPVYTLAIIGFGVYGSLLHSGA